MSNLIVTHGYGDTGDTGGGGAGEFVSLEFEVTTQALSFTVETTDFNIDAVATDAQQFNLGVVDNSFTQTTTNLTFNVEVIELC